MSRDFLDGLGDLNDPFFVADKQADIRANAHIVNGGEAQFTCPACKGSGVFRSYTGRVVGNCFKCKGKRTVSKGVAAAAKGKVTKENNKRAFLESEDGQLLTSLATWNDFARKMAESFDAYGSLTERQLEALRSIKTKADATNAARNASRDAEKTSKSGIVGIEAINAMFATALEAGLKKPVFRAMGLTIKIARLHADRLYVTSANGDYYGKIEAGKFSATREAPANTLNMLCEIASNPKQAAIEYGRATGNCGLCGRLLTDPESISAGIGPICAGKWSM